MITCPGCNATIKPSSLEYHERLHRLQTKEETNKLLEDSNVENDEVSGQKLKRKAAEK